MLFFFVIKIFFWDHEVRNTGRGSLLQNQQSQNYYDDRFRRPQVQPAAVPSVQPTTAQALRSVSAEVPNHRGLSAWTLLSGIWKKRLPTTEKTNTASQDPVVHRIGRLGVRFYQPNWACHLFKCIADRNVVQKIFSNLFRLP